MARYKRGNTVLNWLYSYIHSSTQLPPLSGTIILSLVSLGDSSSVLLISFYALLLFYTFTCLKVSKHVSNNLKILANWGRFLSIQRHPNSGYFGKCHHFLPCHVQQQQKKVSPWYSFWCLHCYSCQETKSCPVSKTVPQTTVVCLSPKVWGMSHIHSEVYTEECKFLITVS